METICKGNSLLILSIDCDQNLEGSPSISSPETTSHVDLSIFRFEDYLRNTLLPGANDELASKIRGYFDLAEMYQRQESCSDNSGPSSHHQQPPPAHVYTSTFSSLPSLVPDDNRYATTCSDLYSTVATTGFSDMLPPSLESVSSKRVGLGGGGGAGRDLGRGKGGRTGPEFNFMQGWDLGMLTAEDEDFTRILFQDLDEQRDENLG